MIHKFVDRTWANAKELFSSGYISAKDLDVDALVSVFYDTGLFEENTHQTYDCSQHAGFNAVCVEKHGQGNNKHRFGFCINCFSQHPIKRRKM